MNDREASEWQVFAAAIEQLPPERQASAFARLALQLVSRDRRSDAARYALRARCLAKLHGTDDEALVTRALRAVTAKYHVQISTDPDRLAAWDAALKHHLRDGMLVLEIGTGSGILAMLAARAGAQVVSCDNDEIIASVAQDVVAQNGMADRIQILPKPVKALRIGADLPRPADVLILDLFGNSLFDFLPFDAVRDARSLLRTDATVVPMRVALKAACAAFGRYNRLVAGHVHGFDLSALSVVQQSRMPLESDDPDLLLRSAPETMLTVDLAAALPDRAGAVERSFSSEGGEINGLAVWIELTLAPGIALEPRPGHSRRGFYARPRFHAFSAPLLTEPGQPLNVRLAWTGKEISVTHAA